ncbi:MAG: TonB-dependent receptor, partial [Acidobacteria bacterium]|nr:TonB-dependent receptor [Acidobacteriota bacterium]
FVNGVTGLNGGPSPTSFNAYASFLLGLPGSMGKAYQFYDPMSTREFDQGYYIRDNWQVTRKLSLNLGLRLEYFPIMDRGQYGIERYDSNTNKVLIGGRGNNPRTAGTDAGVMFGPRVGLAYRANEKTVLRAGYGITNDPYPLSRPLRAPFPAVIIDEYIQTSSFIAPGSLATGIPAVRFPDLSTGVLDIPNTISTTSLLPGKFRRGYIESYNLTIERDLGAGFVIRTGYVGTHSVRQAVSGFDFNAGIVPGAGVNGRPLFGKFGVTTTRSFFIPMANQRYDAWQTNVTRRFTRGLFLSSSYSWSKTLGIDAGNSDNGVRFYVPSQFSKNKAVADFDRTQTWVTAANWELPFGKGKKFATGGVAAILAGGWQLNPGMALYSGRPFIVTTDGSSLNAPGNTQVADQIRPDFQKLGGVGVGAPFFDPTAFAPVREVRFGNMGLNALRGPRLFNMSLGLFRKFPIRERGELQFRAEALNFTNTPVLNQPNATVSTPSNFMMITSTNNDNPSPQRTIRFGLRLSF